MSVKEGVVYICLLGKFSKNCESDEEVCCEFVSLENLAKSSENIWGASEATTKYQNVNMNT